MEREGKVTESEGGRDMGSDKGEAGRLERGTCRDRNRETHMTSKVRASSVALKVQLALTCRLEHTQRVKSEAGATCRGFLEHVDYLVVCSNLFLPLRTM